MQNLYGLFEADGDEEAEDDGDDVNEEVSPGGGGVVGRRVDVEHGGGFLWVCGGAWHGFVGYVFGRRAWRDGVGSGWGLASDLTCDRAQAARVKKWVRESLDYQ